MKSKIVLILQALLIAAAMMGAQACFIPVPYGGGGGWHHYHEWHN